MEPTTLVIVSGVSCSGKSTFATRLGARLRWPVLSKDTIKETLFDTLGTGDTDWSRRLSDAAYALLFAQAHCSLACERSIIVEANFRSGEHEGPLRCLIDELSVHAIQVLCRADPEVLIARFGARRRHSGHLDAALLGRTASQMRSAVQQPLAIRAPVIECDTTDDWRSAIDVAVAMTCERLAAD